VLSKSCAVFYHILAHYGSMGKRGKPSKQEVAALLDELARFLLHLYKKKKASKNKQRRP